MISGFSSLGGDQKRHLFQNNITSLRTTKNHNNSTFLLISEVMINVGINGGETIMRQTILGLDMRGCICEFDQTLNSWR